MSSMELFNLGFSYAEGTLNYSDAFALSKAGIEGSNISVPVRAIFANQEDLVYDCWDPHTGRFDPNVFGHKLLNAVFGLHNPFLPSSLDTPLNHIATMLNRYCVKPQRPVTLFLAHGTGFQSDIILKDEDDGDVFFSEVRQAVEQVDKKTYGARSVILSAACNSDFNLPKGVILPYSELSTVFYRRGIVYDPRDVKPTPPELIDCTDYQLKSY